MPKHPGTTERIERLKRWRDFGDGPIDYTAGNREFGTDVISALAEIERLRKLEAHLLGVIRSYNPDDALFDHEKEMRNAD